MQQLHLPIGKLRYSDLSHSDKSEFEGQINQASPGGDAVFYLAAAAAVVAAAVITAAITAKYAAVVATAAEEDQQDDDPAPVTAAHTVIAHIKYLHRFF